METKTLGAVAAMPQEIAPLLQRVRRYRRGKLAGFNLYRFTCGSAAVVLIESGMGAAHAREATRLLIDAAAPGAILNFGFAGAVLPGLRVGDLVLADRVCRLEGTSIMSALRPDSSLSFTVGDACRREGLEVRFASFLTAAGIRNKGEIAACVKAEHALPVLEMESAAVLEAAHESGIPAVALRGVSDAADEELGFSIEEFCDSQMNVKAGRILLTLARKPHLVGQLIRLAGNSKGAGRNLARGVEVALQALSES